MKFGMEVVFECGKVLGEEGGGVRPDTPDPNAVSPSLVLYTVKKIKYT